MSVFIKENAEGGDIAVSWLAAMEYLLTVGGREANLIVAYDSSLPENPAIRGHLNDFFSKNENDKVRDIDRVAETIFPMDFYFPNLPDAADHLFWAQERARTIEKRWIKCGTYFDRLSSWPDRPELNQLKKKIDSLKEVLKRCKTGNIFELGIDVPVTGQESHLEEGNGESLAIYYPGRDNYRMGFPCLSHISLTLFRGRLSMAALYRNHHFLTKAYGNYVGLGNLLNFICREVGCSSGEVVCVSTHADAQLNRKGELGIDNNAIRQLIRECRNLKSYQKGPSQQGPQGEDNENR